MISIQSSQRNSFHSDKQIKEKNTPIESWLTRPKEALIYHLFCGVYLIFLMMLLTLYIVNSYKSKYMTPSTCPEYDTRNALFWRILNILFYTTLVLASGLIFTSLKYVSEYENQSLLDDYNAQQRHGSDGRRRSSQTSKSDRIEEFIRRNSSVPSANAIYAIQRNPSDLSNSTWLQSARNEAHRRLSSAQLMPRQPSTLNDNNTQHKYSPEIVIEQPDD